MPPSKPLEPTSAAAALAAQGQRRWTVRCPVHIAERSTFGASCADHRVSESFATDADSPLRVRASAAVRAANSSDS